MARSNVIENVQSEIKIETKKNKMGLKKKQSKKFFLIDGILKRHFQFVYEKNRNF